MKPVRRLVAVAAVAALAVGIAPPAFAGPDDSVAIPDLGLQECIAHVLELEPAATYTERQLASLEKLNCRDDYWTTVNDLSGLEHATNLTSLAIYGYELADLAPLEDLPLAELTLSSDQALNLAPLAGMETIQSLAYFPGAASPDIPSFPELTKLELSYFPLSAASAANLPKLAHFIYRGDTETNDSTALPSLPELTELEIHDVPMSVIAAADLSKLTSLKFWAPAETNDSTPLPLLPELTELELHEVSMSAIASADLTKLTSLTYADGIEPVDLSLLPPLPELAELTLANVELASIPSLQLPKLTSLTVNYAAGLLDISGVSSLPELATLTIDAGIASLPGSLSLPKVTRLDLSGNALATIPNSASWPKVEELNLSWNRITDISSLPSMPALERLEIQHNRLTALPALNLPKLDWLGLAHNKIATISASTHVPELNGISLIDNKLTDIAALKSYPSLSTVFVSGNQIADLSYLGTSYPFKGQLHAESQKMTSTPAKGCTLVPLPVVKGAPDSNHPIVWELPEGAVRDGSNVVYPETEGGQRYWIGFTQLGRFTRSDSKDDIYFSGYYYQDVQPATNILAPTPTVAGTARYGSKVSVVGGSWCPATATRSYQWLRDGVPIAKATGSTYILTLPDVGRKISVRVTGSHPGLSTVVKTSAQVVVANATLGAKTPAITGTAKKGKTLKVKMSAWTPAPVKISYQWLRNGKAIKKATKSSYKLTKSDRKKYVSVRVTGSKPGYTTTSRTSAKTAKVK